MLFSIRLGLALTIAETALAACGVNTSVAVVDRAGRLRVFLQGDGAAPHNLELARRKAYTARTFRRTSAEWAKLTETTNAGQRMLAPAGSSPEAMVTEAVNDHVRLLQSQHPFEIESSGIHQVIPWFSGRLDFAPTVRFPGDADFPLRGGAVGYFVDRKAATLVYGRRLHSVSVFVFRADGLPWPRSGLEKLGRLEVLRTASRGFNVLLWRDGELGFALVSDVDPRDLSLLASKLAGPA